MLALARLMRFRWLTGALLLLVALTFAVTCDPSPDDSAPGDPNELHPNTTSPDEQGESGSLIEPETDDGRGAPRP